MTLKDEALGLAGERIFRHVRNGQICDAIWEVDYWDYPNIESAKEGIGLLLDNGDMMFLFRAGDWDELYEDARKEVERYKIRNTRSPGNA